MKTRKREIPAILLPNPTSDVYSKILEVQAEITKRKKRRVSQEEAIYRMIRAFDPESIHNS